MDLKAFIKETITAIAEATVELQSELRPHAVMINPPVTDRDHLLYSKDSTYQGDTVIQKVSFDVALTATSETSGGGGAGLKILSFGVDGEASHARGSENASRISFVVPVALPLSTEPPGRG